MHSTSERQRRAHQYNEYANNIDLFFHFEVFLTFFGVSLKVINRGQLLAHLSAVKSITFFRNKGFEETSKCVGLIYQ